MTGIPVWPRFALKGDRPGLHDLRGDRDARAALSRSTPCGSTARSWPYTAPSPAQPDFYVGWLEGLLRLWPNWEFTFFGRTIGELFLPAVVVPGIIFTTLALWPFVEARVRRDTATHHYAQRPREAPVRSAVGAAGMAMFIVLMLAGSNDVLAKYLQIEVDTLNSVLLVLLFVLPVVVGLLTFWICRDLGRREVRPIERPAARRDPTDAADGGFEATHVPHGRAGGGAVRRLLARPSLGIVATIAAVALSACSSSFGMPRGASEQGRDIFDLWQVFLIAGIVVAGDRLRADRLVAPPVPAAALGRRRGARAPVPRPRAARGRLHGHPGRDRDRAVLAVVPHRGARGRTWHPTPVVTLDAEAFAWGWRFTYEGHDVTVVSDPERRRRHRARDRAPPRRDRARSCSPPNDVDPRVLGPRLPVQARRDPRTREPVRHHAHRRPAPTTACARSSAG